MSNKILFFLPLFLCVFSAFSLKSFLCVIYLWIFKYKFNAKHYFAFYVPNCQNRNSSFYVEIGDFSFKWVLLRKYHDCLYRAIGKEKVVKGYEKRDIRLGILRRISYCRPGWMRGDAWNRGWEGHQLVNRAHNTIYVMFV